MNSKIIVTYLFFILTLSSCKGQNDKNDQRDADIKSSALNDSAILMLAKSHGDTNRMNKALQFIEKSIQEDSLDANAFAIKGSILCNLANYTEAINALNKSLYLHNIPEVKLMKGLIFDKMNQFDSSQQIYNEILNHYEKILEVGNNVKIEVDRALLYFYLNKPDIAKQMYNELKVKYPNEISVVGMKEFVDTFDKEEFLKDFCNNSKDD